jgi:hypothetical protein
MKNFKLVLGLVMLGFCLALIGAFFFPAFHYRWWSNNAYFMTLTILGVIFAIVGSFLVRSSIFRGKQKEALGFELLGYTGYMLVMGGVILGGAALIVAMDVNTNTGVGVDVFGQITSPVYDKALHYPEDFLVMDSQVLLLCFGILSSIAGQFLIGIGNKRQPD